MRNRARIGDLVGSGRRADVYAYEDGEAAGEDGAPDGSGGGGGAWVLRRYRDGRGDVSDAAAVMEYVRGYGYPVPRVRTAGSRTDLVLERLTGPTVLAAMEAGALTAAEGAAVLVRLLDELHTIPARLSADPGVRVLHLDLHPDNVVLTPAGPMVIDWDNTEEGPPGLDWGMSAVLLAQVAVAEDDPRAGPARDVLAALLAGCPDPAVLTGRHGQLVQARQRRAADPATGPAEAALLGDAERLIRGLLDTG